MDVYIRHALAENRTVQAARYNLLALKHRIPQVTALDDPVVSNTIYPSNSNGLQTAAGYLPWNLLIAQQFPWFGTLRLRGAAASDDVQVALAELAAAQLDVVEAVKRAYYDLYFNRSGRADPAAEPRAAQRLPGAGPGPLREWPDQPAGGAPG